METETTETVATGAKSETVARKPSKSSFKSTLVSLSTWVVGLLVFFPIIWMVLNGFKTEADANGDPVFFFTPTFDQFREQIATNQGQLGFTEAFTNSAIISIGSTILVILLAVPAAYALSISAIPKWKDVLFFFISTKFLPVVAAIVPIFVIFEELNIDNSRIGLLVLYTSINLPLAIWMLRSFLADVPKELVEAARIDGAGLITQLRSVIVPLVAPGLAATALLCFIFAWNEFFFAVQLNPVEGRTITVWLNENFATRGQFLARLSASSTLAVLPVVIAGWVAQKRMIRGLALGAIK